MPQSLTWRDDWAVSIDALDDDHRALVHLLSGICQRYADQEARPDGRSSPGRRVGQDIDLIADLERLGEQVRDHFQREEALMRSIDYPGLPAHQCEHALLMAEYRSMVRELKEQGETHLDPAAMENLNDWMIPQILGADRALADYYFQILHDSQPAAEL